MWANWLPIITLVATLTKDLPKTLEMDFTKHLCGYQYFAYTPSKSTPSNILKAKCFLPLPIRSHKHQLLGFGLGWENVHFTDHRINGDNLWKDVKVLKQNVTYNIQTSKIIPIHRRDLTALRTISSIDYYVISHAQI